MLNRQFSFAYLLGLAAAWPAHAQTSEDLNSLWQPREGRSHRASSTHADCPWRYPDRIRSVIALPVHDAKLNLPIRCSLPVVDAVLTGGPKGAVVPLANYTLQPQKKVTLTVQTAKPVRHILSVHQGSVSFQKVGSKSVKFSLPLPETDFVKLYY